MFWATVYLAFSFFLTAASGFLVTFLQHTFSVTLLGTRVEETALGVAIAAPTAMILLPNPDRRASDESLANLVDTMTRVAIDAAGRPTDPTLNTVTGEVLTLDRVWEAFRASSGPIAHTLKPDSVRQLRARRLLASAQVSASDRIAHHAEHLAAVATALHQYLDGPRRRRVPA